MTETIRIMVSSFSCRHYASFPLFKIALIFHFLLGLITISHLY
uniref:Uncharacterized protein n=1 Tax=Rhizophora mucronata TaxID=61149 RepID=A0A2P2PKI9_RHIMU